METPDIAILALTSLAGGIISSIIGMGGGMMLYAVMLLFMEPVVAIPLHGIVQLASNISRVFFQREYLNWKIIGSFSLLVVPMSFLGIAIAQQLPASILRLIIGIFVIIATWVPAEMLLRAQAVPTEPDRSLEMSILRSRWQTAPIDLWVTVVLDKEQSRPATPYKRFIWLGGVAGFLNAAVGFAGAFTGPFFLNLGLSRFALVGTKATCHAFAHLSKSFAFGLAGFSFLDWGILLALLSLSGAIGTWIGNHLLHKVDEDIFMALYKWVLTLIGIRLLLKELGPLLLF